MILFGLISVVIGLVQAAPSCHVLPNTCLPDSLPILKELHTTDVAECCDACLALTDCASWTVNTDQKLCHLRATYTGHTKAGKCTSGTVPVPPPPTPPKSAKNVLMILIDDLRPQLGCYNKTKMHTPNIDKLAAQGLVFSRAYCQYAVCSPSRNSFMSGRRPDTTLVYNFKDDFRHAPNGTQWLSFPQAFKSAGFNTTGCGKTYHSGHPKNFDQPYSWTQGVDYMGYDQGINECGDGKSAFCIVPNENETDLMDSRIADRAIELFGSHQQHNIKPWAVFAGFLRPHVDWRVPQWAYDLYPLDTVDPPKNPTLAPTAPKVAWVDGGYIDKKTLDLGSAKYTPYTPLPTNISTAWRRGYYASVSFVDKQIGRVLDELDRLGLRNSTVVGLLADHGYQLGEHAMWEKYTNWELAARVPFIISDPDSPSSHGKTTDALVEAVDMYPTLAELAGIKAESTVEGFSAAPLLQSPHRLWKLGAISQYARCSLQGDGFYTRCSGEDRQKIQVMGYALRTQDWRYVEWFKFNDATLKPDFNSTIARELYDHRTAVEADYEDSELMNVVNDTQYSSIVARHAELLRAGWRHLIPQ